jgi:hypothetical protein
VRLPLERRAAGPPIKGGGDERVPQGVERDDFGDPGASGDLADDPPGAVPVHPTAVRGREHRPIRTLADGQVDRPGGARR